MSMEEKQIITVREMLREQMALLAEHSKRSDNYFEIVGYTEQLREIAKLLCGMEER